MMSQIRIVHRLSALRWFGAAYLALVVALFCFMAVDACADAGGVVFGLPWSCVGYRASEFVPLAARPWPFWIFTLVVPAAPIAVLALVLRRRVR